MWSADKPPHQTGGHRPERCRQHRDLQPTILPQQSQGARCADRASQPHRRVPASARRNRIPGTSTRGSVPRDESSRLRSRWILRARRERARAKPTLRRPTRSLAARQATRPSAPGPPSRQPADSCRRSPIPQRASRSAHSLPTSSRSTHVSVSARRSLSCSRLTRRNRSFRSALKSRALTQSPDRPPALASQRRASQAVHLPDAFGPSTTVRSRPSTSVVMYGNWPPPKNVAPAETAQERRRAPPRHRTAPNTTARPRRQARSTL